MRRIAAFYCFTPLDGLPALKARLRALCEGLGLRGTILLAPEGFNGSLSGEEGALAIVNGVLGALAGSDPMTWRATEARGPTFRRLKVRLKREIVTLGQPGIDPRARVGRRVSPAEWNRLLSDPDVAVIDVRNAFEVALGSFPGAIDPGTRSFREFAGWWDSQKDRFRGRTVAMFCTGGIRCEKATSYALASGAGEVVHLKGGILGYLDAVPPALSLWRGACFVFDERGAEFPAEGAAQLASEA